MKRTLLIAALLALASCGPAPGADGYVFERKQWDIETVIQKKVEYSSLHELQQAAARDPRIKIEQFGEVHAFAEANPNGHCTIHFVNPLVSYQPVWAGHENMHCHYGAWHS